MGRIVITPDDDSYNAASPTFLVYDSASKQRIHTCEQLPVLNAADVAGQGRPTFRPFGIAHDAQYLYIVSHNKLAAFDKHTYEFLNLIDVPLYINTHEMVAHDGVLYVANTANNTIGIYNLNTRENKFFDVTTLALAEAANTPERVDSHDTAHVNSLCAADGKVYFCLHHLDKRPSQLGYFEIDTFKAEIVAEAGRCNHGVQVMEGALYSLSTGTGEVVEVDLATGLTALYKVVDSTKTFLRGLDVVNGNLIFGGSNTYSEDRAIYMNNCFIARFDTVTKKAAVALSINDAYIISDMKVLN